MMVTIRSKVLSSALVVVIMLAAAFFSGFMGFGNPRIAHALQSEEFTFTVADDDTTITEYNGSGGDAVIPGELDGKVVSIQEETSQASGNWLDEGNYDAAWYNTAQTAFTLTTAQQLAGLISLVNGGTNFSGRTVTLGADINLSAHYWTAIGMVTTSRPFAGTFDGAEYEIVGLTIDTELDYQGLFGYVTGVVKNVRLVDSNVRGRSYVGGVAGYITSSNYIVLENCSSVGSVSSEGDYAGGIAGRVYESFDFNGYRTIKDCYQDRLN